jgi:hypothetical protein
MDISIPNGIEIKKCSHGYGIFATKKFKKGHTIANVENEVIINDAKKAPMCSLKVFKFKIWWGHRYSEIHHWDCFIDDSNVPNSRFAIKQLSQKVPFIALACINKGDELFINSHEYGDKLYKDKRYVKPSSDLK